MGSAAFKASKPKNASDDAAESSESQATRDADARLNYVMGDDREAVGFHDTNIVSDKVADRVNELANRMDEALHFKQPTRERNRGRNRNIAKTKTEKEKGASLAKVSSVKVVTGGWRRRVMAAKENAAATLSVMRLLESNLVKMRNYYDFVPPAIEEALDDDFKKFLEEYAKITKVLADVKQAHDEKEKKAPKTGKGLNKKKAETDALLHQAGVDEAGLLGTESTDEARKYAKEAVAKSKQAELDDALGVDLKDERIHGSLTLLETYLSRANEMDGIERDVEGEGEGKPPTEKHLPLKNPVTQSHDVWQNNPGSKPEVLRMTSEAKSNAKYGKTAVLIFAADLGPERHGAERQPLWSMEPYEMLAEIHQEQRHQEYVEKAAALKKEFDEKVERGEAEASTEAELPIQPPAVSTPMTTHVEGMGVGARLMTQLVADVTEHCGAKAIECLRVILVVSNSTASVVSKDIRANNFYGLKRENVLFITQPDLPGFRYVPEINLFREDGTSKHARYGSGFVIEQLTCPGEAYLLSDAIGTPAHLVESALDHLSSIGVEWIFKTRSRLIANEMFDIKFMAHSMALKERLDANMIFDVVETTLHTSRKWGNIAAARPPNDHSKFEAGAPYYTRIIGNEALSSSEAQQAILDNLAAQPDDKKTLYSSTGRWMLHLSDMQEALDGIRFTPTFCLEYELEDEARLPRLKAPPAIYPQVYAFDLTLVDAIRPMSISVTSDNAPKDIGQLNLVDPIAFIRYISKVQDARANFQNLVKKASMEAASKGKDAPSLVLMSTGSVKRHVITVAVAENKSCLSVLELINHLVIPGVDEIHIVHFCRTSDAATRAHKVISQFDVESAVQVTRHVLIQPSGRSLPEMIAETAADFKTTLLVLASEKLDRSAEPAMGSVAFTLCRKNLPCSVLIVKTHSNAAKNAKLGLSFVAGVNAAGLEMFDWICNIARRGQDKFYLANCSGTTSTSGTRRATNNGANIVQVFKDKAVSRGFMPVGRMLDGKAGVELPKLSQQVQADILVISAAKNTGEVSKGALDILKSPLSSAVLIFKPADDTRMGL